MTIVVRADANSRIGSGHVVRTAALAARAVRMGHDVRYVYREMPASLERWITKQGFDLQRIRALDMVEDATETSATTGTLSSSDWLIVDHYSLDQQWESLVDRGDGRLWVIDDLANRFHLADVLMDTGMHTVGANPYSGLVPPNCSLLLGPSFALLRPEFDSSPCRERDGRVSRILVFLGGGTSVGDELRKIAQALCQLETTATEIAVLAAPDDLRGLRHFFPSEVNVRFLVPMVDMVELLSWADLAIGTCGGSTWERCLLGVPALVVVLEENQRADAEALTEIGAVRLVGDKADTHADLWGVALEWALAHPLGVREMSTQARRIFHDRPVALNRLDGLLARK